MIETIAQPGPLTLARVQADATAANGWLMIMSTEARGLAKLKAAGVLNWLRRAVEAVAPAGGFLLRQISNAYHVCSTANWKGYKPPPPPPPPAPGTWGDHPSMGSALDVAASLRREGALLQARLDALESDAPAAIPRGFFS
jgi:hypothetical protein